MLFLKKGWKYKIKVKKINDRNLDGVFNLMLLIYGENMKKYVSKFMLNILRNSMTKNRFLHVQKTLSASTVHDLEFLMLLKGNSLQNVTFFCKNSQKVIEE